MRRMSVEIVVAGDGVAIAVAVVVDVIGTVGGSGSGCCDAGE